jgi:hypothetical protein
MEGAGDRLRNFRFSIADPSALLRPGFRLREKSDAQHIAETILEFLLRQSKIENLW